MTKAEPQRRTYFRLWFSWLLLVTGLGGMLQFAMLCAIEGSPSSREWFIWLWPGSGVVFVLLGALYLRRYYWFQAPPELRPKFALSDLIIVLIWTGLLGAGLQHFTEVQAFPIVFLLGALVSDSCLLVGFAAASRGGQRPLLVRILFAASVFGIMYGLMVVLGFAVFLFLRVLMGDAGEIIWVMMIVLIDEPDRLRPFVIFMRAGALAGIVGAVLASALDRASPRRREQPQQGTSDGM